MLPESRHFKTDIAIIGSGLAGFAASIFATNRNIPCALAGNTGAIAYTTGYLDLLGCIDNHTVNDPWEEISKLRATHSNHPLARLSRDELFLAIDEFTSFISECGIRYTKPGNKNLSALTPIGTLKPTLCVPATMQKGVLAHSNKTACTIIGIRGLKGFSANQIQTNLAASWPLLRSERLSFPGHEKGELYPEVAARALEVPQNRIHLAKAIQHAAAGSKVVGLPAILGIHRPDDVLADLERISGIELFEIPTMPPSVAGIRLREMFEQVFPQKGLQLIPQQKVKKITFDEEAITLSLSDNFGPITISAKTAILATGRFLSGGLQASIDHIRESLIDLPVTQPEHREDWFHKEYMDRRGHNIHLAGIEADKELRPLNTNQKPFDKRLFAAGIVLAHQDWIRQRCGAGVAIATAYRAVESASNLLNR